MQALSYTAITESERRLTGHIKPINKQTNIHTYIHTYHPNYHKITQLLGLR